MSSSSIDIRPTTKHATMRMVQRPASGMDEVEVEHPSITLRKGTIVRVTDMPREATGCRKVCVELRTNRGPAWIRCSNMPFRMDLGCDVYRNSLIVAHVCADGLAFQRAVGAHPFRRQTSRPGCSKIGKLTRTEGFTYTEGFTVLK